MYGLALIFTDAQTKDVHLEDEIITLRNRKKIKIFIALAPNYQGTVGDDSWLAYERISEGRIFNMAVYNNTRFISEVVSAVGENCEENNNCIRPTTLGNTKIHVPTNTKTPTSGSKSGIWKFHLKSEKKKYFWIYYWNLTGLLI